MEVELTAENFLPFIGGQMQIIVKGVIGRRKAKMYQGQISTVTFLDSSHKKIQVDFSWAMVSDKDNHQTSWEEVDPESQVIDLQLVEVFQFPGISRLLMKDYDQTIMFFPANDESLLLRKSA